MITRDRLNELFVVDAARGILIWKAPPSRHRRLLGQEAGTLNVHGYVQIKVDGHLYRRSRLIWLAVHGRWPDPQIDHINLVKTDDRIDNLREATASQNLRNTSIPRNNSSGVKGVDWHGAKQKWRARITLNGKTKSLGLFNELTDAAAARDAVLTEVHGDFARAA